MRAFIVAEDDARRAALRQQVVAAGHEVCGDGRPETVTAEIRKCPPPPPDLLVIERPGDVASLRRLIGRARDAAEARLPAGLVLAVTSSWLRGALPHDLQPALAITADEPLTRILDWAAAVVGQAPLPAHRAAPVLFDPVRRELTADGTSVHLTRSEGAILGALMLDQGAVVEHVQLAQALWGSPVTDRHSRASIRSHVHTLRGKLRDVGLGGVMTTIPGVGYRLLLD